MKRYLLLAALPLVLAACAGSGDEVPAATNEPPVPAATSDSSATAIDTTTTVTPATTVMLDAVDNSGVTGTAQVAPGNPKTQVMVTLGGLDPNSAHAGHIHEGSCASPGAVVAPLPDITADANGGGMATASVEIPADSLMDGQHVIAYHKTNGSDHGPTITCGAIPAK